MNTQSWLSLPGLNMHCRCSQWKETRKNNSRHRIGKEVQPCLFADGMTYFKIPKGFNDNTHENKGLNREARYKINNKNPQLSFIQ